MNIYELEIKVNEEYPCTLYEKKGDYRLYVNHTSKVASYLEIEVDDETKKVISIKPVCYYYGKKASGPKWYADYTESARRLIHEVAAFAYSML